MDASPRESLRSPQARPELPTNRPGSWRQPGLGMEYGQPVGHRGHFKNVFSPHIEVAMIVFVESADAQTPESSDQNGGMLSFSRLLCSTQEAEIAGLRAES